MNVSRNVVRDRHSVALPEANPLGTLHATMDNDRRRPVGSDRTRRPTFRLRWCPRQRRSDDDRVVRRISQPRESDRTVLTALTTVGAELVPFLEDSDLDTAAFPPRATPHNDEDVTPSRVTERNAAADVIDRGRVMSSSNTRRTIGDGSATSIPTPSPTDRSTRPGPASSSSQPDSSRVQRADRLL